MEDQPGADRGGPHRLSGDPALCIEPDEPAWPDDRLRDVTAIDHVFGLTYRLIVGDAAIVPNGRPIVPQGPCPALLWVEHHYARPEISDEELARIAGFSGPIRLRRLQRGDARALLAVYGIREALPRRRPGQR